MIGDAEIRIAALPGGLRHFGECVHAIGKVRMEVEKAAQIPGRDELGKCPFFCLLDLVCSFAQLRGDEGKAKRLVDVFLARSRNQFPTAVQRARGEGQSPLAGKRCQLRDMALAAGGAYERHAKARRRTRMKRDDAEAFFGHRCVRVYGDEPQVGNELAAMPQFTERWRVCAARAEAASVPRWCGRG